jgi:glycosyltransferase involved in cell wall biosynthesis
MRSNRDILILVTPGFAASADDSSCLPLQQALVRAWQDAAPGCDVVVLALHYPYHGDAYTLFGASVFAYNGRNRGGLSGWRRAKKVGTCLASLHREHSIRAIVSCWYGEAAALASSFAHRNGLRHYCWILGQDARSSNHWPRKLLLPARELVALSPFLQMEFERSHAVKPQWVIGPGVESTTAPVEGSRALLLLGVGSLIALKRWTVFLQVAAALRRELPDLKAVLVGSGPEEVALRREAALLGLEDCVQFAGPLPHAAVLRLMGSARLLLHPSGYEGYSGVCQEALSVGTPVLSCCVPGGDLPAGWHQAQHVDEMLPIAKRLLAVDTGIAVKGFPIEATARQWLDLFENGNADQSVPISERSPLAMASKEN